MDAPHRTRHDAPTLTRDELLEHLQTTLRHERMDVDTRSLRIEALTKSIDRLAGGAPIEPCDLEHLEVDDDRWSKVDDDERIES